MTFVFSTPTAFKCCCSTQCKDSHLRIRRRPVRRRRRSYTHTATTPPVQHISIKAGREFCVTFNHQVQQENAKHSTTKSVFLYSKNIGTTLHLVKIKEVIYSNQQVLGHAWIDCKARTVMLHLSLTKNAWFFFFLATEIKENVIAVFFYFGVSH